MTEWKIVRVVGPPLVSTPPPEEAANGAVEFVAAAETWPTTADVEAALNEWTSQGWTFDRQVGEVGRSSAVTLYLRREVA